MIQLDYRTNNPRWGLSGIVFDNWNEFCLTLGFLSNIDHYEGRGVTTSSIWSHSISVHIEHNNKQGAWNKEGRIHYYKNLTALQNNLVSLYNNRSAGNGRITCRINSNGYMMGLIKDFGFQLITYVGYDTADIIPPQNAYQTVKASIQQYLIGVIPDTKERINILNYFDMGWNL